MVDFTIHNDVELRGQNGLYLMLVAGDPSDVGFHFGLQTDVHSPQRPSTGGKGLLFSRCCIRASGRRLGQRALYPHRADRSRGSFPGRVRVLFRLT